MAFSIRTLILGKPRDEELEPEFIPSPLHSPMLNYKVYVMGLVEEIVVRLLFFIGGGLVGLVFYSGLFKVDDAPTIFTYIADVVVFIIVGIAGQRMFVPIYVESRKLKRSTELSNQFRDMLDALASSFATGSNVMMAFRSALEDLRHQYDATEYIVREVEEIVDAQDQGVGVDVMLRDFANRSGDDDIDSFADVFDIFSRNGGDVTGVIQRMRGIITDKAAVSDEIQTKLTSNKLQLNGMTVMPLAVLMMLRLTNKELAANFATPIGVAACTVALAIIVAAYRLGNKIVNVKV